MKTKLTYFSSKSKIRRQFGGHISVIFISRHYNPCFYMSNTGGKVASNGSNSYDTDGAIVSDYWI
jgi:hypothetical protein